MASYFPRIEVDERMEVLIYFNSGLAFWIRISGIAFADLKKSNRPADNDGISE